MHHLHHMLLQLLAIMAVTGGVLCAIGIVADTCERLEPSWRKWRARRYVLPRPDGAIVVKRPKYYVHHWSADVGRRYRAP